MATLYWGGGSGTWNPSSTTNWYTDLARTVLSTAAPTYADSVIFDSASNATGYTVTLGGNFTGTGSITGTVLTITAVTSGTLAVGQSIGSSVATFFGGTYIVSLGTGTGGIGTYNLNISQTIASGTITSVPACLDITVSGPATGTVTFTGTGALMCYGNMSLPATGATSSVSSAIYFVATSAKTITTSGVTWTTGQARFDGVGGDWTLGSNTTISTTANSGGVNVYRGTFRTGNFNLTSAALTSNSGLTRAIYLGSSTVTLNTINNSALTIASTTGLTWDAGTSTIVFSGSTGVTAAGAGLTFNNVNCTATTSGSSIAFTGANTFANLSVTSPAASSTKAISFDSNTTITGTLTLGAANSSTSRILVRTPVAGTQITITAAAVATLSDVDFRDIAAAGASAPWSGTRLGDCLNNSNITFPVSKTVYWNLAAGGSWTSAAWASTPTGTPDNTTNFPLAQDNVIISETGLNSGATITMNAAYQVGNINMTTRTTAFNYSMGTADTNLYGNLILGTGTTITGGNGMLYFNGYGRQQYFETMGKTFDCSMTMACPTGNVIISNNIVMGSTRTFTMNFGNLVTNGYSLYAGLFSSTGTNARGVRLSGGSNITLLGNNGTIWTTATATNFSVEGGPLNVYSTYSGATGTRTVSMGAPTAPVVKNRVNFYVTAGTDTVTNAASAQFGDLNFTGFSGTLANVARFVNGNLTLSPTMTQAVGTTLLTINGTGDNLTINTNNIAMQSPVTIAALTSNVTLVGNLTIASTSNAFTLTSGNISIDGYTITAGTFSSSNSNVRRLDFGSTGKMVLTASNTTVWGGGTVTNFSVSGIPNVYITGSDPIGTRLLNSGSPIESQVVNFIVTGSGPVSLTSRAGDLDLSGFTGTLQNSAVKLIYGNVIIGSSTVLEPGTNALTLGGTLKTQLVYTNGLTITFPLQQSGVGGTVSLMDDMNIPTSNTYTLINGTLDLNGKTMTTGTFATAAGTKSITFNGGTINVTASGSTAWNNAAPTNFTTTVGTGTGNGYIYMSGSSDKTFVGGGSTYAATIMQNGAGNLTITGSNTFTNLYTPVIPTHVLFTNGTTNTFTSGFTPAGFTNNMVTLASTTAGSTFTISCAAGQVVARNMIIRDSVATGGAAFYAPLSVNQSNNTGWQFQGPPVSIGRGISLGGGITFS